MDRIEAIGIIETPHKQLEDMPIQPKGARGVEGKIIIKNELSEGLKSLDGFSHIYLIYHLHEVKDVKLTVTPFMDTKPHGIFATRSPARPNRIGMSIVEVKDVTDNIITIDGADVLDGTPLLDIKPYIHHFDNVLESRNGWIDESPWTVESRRSDSRFTQ